MAELDRRERRLGRVFQITASRLKTGARVIKAILSAGGAALAGISLLIAAHSTLEWVLGSAGVVMCFGAAIWIIWTEENAPLALEEARKALSHARTLEAEMRGFRDDVAAETRVLVLQSEQQRRLLGLVDVLRESVERILAEDGDIPQAFQRLLEGSRRVLLGVLGIEGAERWTVTIYRFQAGKLRRQAGITVDAVEPATGFREWRSGEGWTGAAYKSQHEIVLADAQSATSLAMLNLPAAKARSDDSSRYRSIAAIPVRVAGRKLPWGVVIATSDRRGRFDDDAASLGAISAQAIRLLAGMAALVAAGQINVPGPVARPRPRR